VLRTTTGLGTNDVSVSFKYRCGTATTYVDNEDTCGTVQEWTFVRISLTDSYEPFWTSMGVGSSVPLGVVRTVQIS
jgi:hypothetical protein